MPKKTTANGRAETGGAANPPPDRPVVYPELAVNGVPIPKDKLRVTDAVMKTLMGWESEQEFADALVAGGKLTRAKADELFKEGKVFASAGLSPLLTDEHGHKVICHNNLTNRDFHEKDARAYAQEILERRWRLNGETVIVGSRGSALSIQHRGAGLILACQLWEKDPAAYPAWKERPWIETLVVTGVDEGYETVQTLDNGVPRTLADTLATGRVFDDWTLPDDAGNRKPLARDKRSEAAKLVDRAIKLAWKRTGAVFDVTYQTNAASRDFLNHHPGLMRACRHVFELDQDRGISRLRLPVGGSAALCYLMSTAGTGDDECKAYFAGRPRGEAALDLSYADKAEEFWELLAAARESKDKKWQTVVSVLDAVRDGKDYGAAQVNDKLIVVVVNAWNRFAADERISKETIEPKVILRDGERVLDEEKLPTVGGIDLGQKPENPNEPTVSEEEAERAKIAERERKAAEIDATRTGVGKAHGAVAEAVAAARKKAPGRLLLFARSDGSWNSFDADADAVASVFGGKPKERPDGMREYKTPAAADLDTLASQLRIKGHKPTKVTNDGKDFEDLHTPVEKPAPLPGKAKPAAPPAAPKPAPAAAPPAAAPANGTAPGGKGKMRKAPVPLRGGIG